LARACSEGTAGCMECTVDGCIGMTMGSVGINIIFSSVGITLEWGSIGVLFDHQPDVNSVRRHRIAFTPVQSRNLWGPLVKQLLNSRFWFLWFCGVWLLVSGWFFKIRKALLCGFCGGPLLENRAPPVIAGRRGCPSSPTLLPASPALPLVGTAAGGAMCCVAEGLRRCDYRYQCFIFGALCPSKSPD